MARNPAAAAERLILEFGSLAKVTAGSRRRLERVVGDEPAILGVIEAHRAAMLHALRENVVDRPILAGSAEVSAYLQVEMGAATSESLRVLFLNVGNRLIADEIVATGTLDAVPFYPRTLVERALELGAASLILAHNHPSGDDRPSPSDIERTRGFARTCQGLGIILHDHLIVCSRRVTSLRSLGLLDHVV